MKVIIIEDELLVAEDLSSSLKQIRPEVEIQCILCSVKESIDYFTQHPQPDLIFSDIQLGDGLSFEISKHIQFTVPVIFCTAFDDYAIEAFKANGIEYILKPFNIASLEKAISKFENLRKQLAGEIEQKYKAAMKALASYKLINSGTFMVKYRDRFVPVSFDKIALFYLESEINHLYTHSGKTYLIPENLEEVEKKAGPAFFRVNRQFLVNHNAIQDVIEHFPRKLKVNLKFTFTKEIMVSKEKRSKLLNWLAGNL